METCPATGKHCYRSPEHARRVMRRLAASLRVYRCNACHKFHFTKKHST